MNPNFKKKKPLTYKNLGELYTEAVQGEPSINRLPIVETGSVLITRDNGAEDVLRQGVSDDILDKIDVILNEKELVDIIDKAIKDRADVLKSEILSGLIALSLREAIKTSGNALEIKNFCEIYSKGAEFINIEALTTFTDNPQIINKFITDPFARNVFKYLFKNLPAGKNDAGPGEGALVALSPNISYASGGGDIIINGGRVEVKASKNVQGSGGRVWDKDVAQTGMVEALSGIYTSNPGIFPDSQQRDSWKMTVVAATNKNELVSIIEKYDSQNNFLNAACIAWFGEFFQDVIDSFGTKYFTTIWHKHIFNTYKKDKEFNGLLSIGINTYHYATTEDEFVQMKFYNNGSICNTESGQDRDLAPQLKIR